MQQELSGRQTVLAEVVDPPDQPVNVTGRLLQGAATQGNYSFATIGRVLSVGQPAVAMEIGYGPADRRYGNTGHLVKGGHAAGPSFEAAQKDLINDAQLIECRGASVLPGHHSEQIPREFDNGRGRYVVWFVRPVLLLILRIFR